MKTYEYINGELKSVKTLTAQQKNTRKAAVTASKTTGERPELPKIEKEYVNPVKKDADKLAEIWNKIKPTEKNSKVIHASVTLDEKGKERGIINYRTENGEHRQKRF